MRRFTELYEKVTTIAQRRKMSQRMRRMARSPSYQLKKKRSALKMRDPAKLLQIARKQTIKKFRAKLYPEYKDMPLQQRVKVDQIVMTRYGKKIDVISKKLVTKLRGGEAERIKKARDAMGGDDA